MSSLKELKLQQNVKNTCLRGVQHTHWIWKVPTNDSESIAMSKSLEITNVLRKDVPVYHSRSVKREFISLFGRCTGYKPGILQNIYRRITGDASASTNATEAEVDKRVAQLLDIEDADVIWDLRANCSGRPEEYEEYLAKVSTFITRNVELSVHDR